MADIKTSDERSYNMSRIRGKNTKPEVLVRKYLFAEGFRYRINDKRYPGKPDIVLPKYKTAIFVHGCFWHQHKGCKIAHIPEDNRDFWVAKFQKNIERDAMNRKLLCDDGWHVIIIWECEISSRKKRDIRLPALKEEIKKSKLQS